MDLINKRISELKSKDFDILENKIIPSHQPPKIV